MFLASLPWYDLPEIRSANDALWSHLAANLRTRGFTGVPERLDRSSHYREQWYSGELLFSQACGYNVLNCPERLQLIATPVYSTPACGGGHYTSVIVVRHDSPAEHLEHLRGARCVINTLDSHSGMNVLRSLVAPLHSEGKFFSSVMMSGSHEASLRCIASGTADVAAIDCVLYALLERHRPEELRSTRVLCSSGRIPAPP